MIFTTYHFIPAYYGALLLLSLYAYREVPKYQIPLLMLNILGS